MGGMAEVYKAFPTKNPVRILAIKRILPQFSRNKELINMLINEAGVSVMLSHPNIVPVIDFGMVGDTYFLAMEYVYGKDLKSVILEILRRKQTFPQSLAIYITIQVLRGLDYAHMKTDQFQRPLQIVHRDISPQNIMLSYTGQVKVLDFGIAKITAKADENEAGLLKGKFSYMSPEQAYGKSVDPRTDVFSTGTLLWELLATKNCFTGKSDLEILEKVRNAQVPSLKEANPNVSSDLVSIVMQALEKKPKARISTAGEFADKLEQFLLERFGRITETDVAALLQSLFAEQIKREQQNQQSFEANLNEVLKGKIKEESQAEIALETEDDLLHSRPRIHAAPWIKKPFSQKIKPFVPALILLTTLLGMGVFFPYAKLFQWTDQWMIDQARLLKNKLGMGLVRAPGNIELPLYPIEQPFYTLIIQDEVKDMLDDLSFEAFEKIQMHLEDLSSQPVPRSTLDHEQHFTSQTLGFSIECQLDEENKQISVISIEEI